MRFQRSVRFYVKRTGRVFVLINVYLLQVCLNRYLHWRDLVAEM